MEDNVVNNIARSVVTGLTPYSIFARKISTLFGLGYCMAVILVVTASLYLLIHAIWIATMCDKPRPQRMTRMML